MDYNRELEVFDSSQITKLHYSTVTGEMLVRFSNGNLYRYRNTPPAVFGELCSAESIGKHFNQIKSTLKGDKIK